SGLGHRPFKAAARVRIPLGAHRKGPSSPSAHSQLLRAPAPRDAARTRTHRPAAVHGGRPLTISTERVGNSPWPPRVSKLALGADRGRLALAPRLNSCACRFLFMSARILFSLFSQIRDGQSARPVVI